MTAKNKEDFLFNLHNELHRIGVEDNKDIFADFEEHFRASAEQGYTEEETCAKLGDVKEIARSYIDIESTMINSIVANAIEDSRPHVSLTKPGRSVSLSEKLTSAPAAEAPADVEESPKTEIITEQPTAIREITPEHIAAEQAAPAPTATSAAPINAAPAQTANANNVFPVIPFPQSDSTQESSQRTITPEHIAAEQPAPSPIPMPAGSDSGEIHTAPAVEPMPAPEPPQPAPEQPKEEHNDEHKGHIPFVDNDDGKGGFKWSDIKGRTPNVNTSKLIGQICIDVFVLSWALPLLATLIWHFLTVVIFGLAGFAISQFAGESVFHLLSRIFLCGGLFSLCAVLGMLWLKMIKGFFHIIKSAVIGHVKAIYDL